MGFLKKTFFLALIVLSILLFGCLAPPAGPTPIPTTTPTPSPTPTASPTATPIGQVQQTATPTVIAPTFNLEALKASVEASMEKLFPNLKPFSLDQYTDADYGIFYKKEAKVKEQDTDVVYFVTVRRATAAEMKPGSGSVYPKVKTIDGETVYYEVQNEGTPAQRSLGAVSCVSEGLNKAFILFDIKNKVMNIDDVFKEFVKAC